MRVVARRLESLRRSEPVRKLLFARDLAGRRASRRLSRAAAAHPMRDWLTPVLVDYYSRDGSTLMMRLLRSSPQVAVAGAYPYEQKLFQYLWRWSRLLARSDWDREAWGPRDLGSIWQEGHQPLMGPPPWRQRDFLEGVDADAPPLAERCFEFAWRELSRRATAATRIAHRAPEADVRFYAEKHLNTWLVDRQALPRFRLVVLLRDPRDTYASLLAFRASKNADMGQRHATDEAEYLDQFIDRQRQRLAWIAGLREDEETVIVRYEELVRSLPSAARRLSGWLGVELNPDDVARDRRQSWVHRTAPSPEESIGRWRADLPRDVAETISREL